MVSFSLRWLEYTNWPIERQVAENIKQVPEYQKCLTAKVLHVHSKINKSTQHLNLYLNQMSKCFREKTCEWAQRTPNDDYRVWGYSGQKLILRLAALVMTMWTELQQSWRKVSWFFFLYWICNAGRIATVLNFLLATRWQPYISMASFSPTLNEKVMRVSLSDLICSLSWHSVFLSMCF